MKVKQFSLWVTNYFFLHSARIFLPYIPYTYPIRVLYSMIQIR